MSVRHLDEAALEALAHDREDLVSEADLAHVDACASCAAALAEAGATSAAMAVALRAATPAVEDLDAMIDGALAHATPAPLVVRPSRRALLLASAAGLAATLFLGLLSLPSLGSVVAMINDAFAVVGALDRVVTVAVPGAWTTVTLLGLAVLAMTMIALRSMAGGGTRLPGSAIGALFLALLANVGTARALELEGDWPADERAVTVSVDHQPASAALRAAAESVGLGLVATLPEDPEVTLHVRDASLREVVEAVLGDAPVTARRSARMLIIRPSEGTSGMDAGVAPAAAPEAPGPPGPPRGPDPPPPPPAPSASLGDRVTFGSDVVVRAGERVNDVVTMGGDVTVEGEVLGEVVTMGGDVTVVTGGVVRGDVTTMGGDVTVAAGGAVHGEVGTMGGDLEVQEGGEVRGSSSGPRVGGRRGPRFDIHHGRRAASPVLGWFEDAAGSAAKHGLLFLLGVLLVALMPERLATLQRMMVAQPARSAVSGLLGFVGSVVLIVVLAITILGIPGAIIVALGMAAGIYVGMVVVATVLGGALPVGPLRERPLLQLAAGVGILFLASLVPVLGTLVQIAAAAVGFGAVLLTRFGRLLPPAARPGGQA